METFSALLAICAGNSPVPGEFPTQRPVTRSFDVYFELRPNKRLSKQSRPLWRHRTVPTYSSRIHHRYQSKHMIAPVSNGATRSSISIGISSIRFSISNVYCSSSSSSGSSSRSSSSRSSSNSCSMITAKQRTTTSS